MDPLKKQMQEGVDQDDIAGAVAIAQDASGKFNYSMAVGNRTLLDGTKKPLKTSDVLALYSCTKLFTTVAVLQFVEKGLLDLDADVSQILPFFKTAQVLTSLVDGKPGFEKPKKPVTWRHLLTHSGGTPYELMDPQLAEWRKISDSPRAGMSPKLEERFNAPLGFQPGERFGYGPGLDWAGRAIELLNKSTLEEYFREHIFAPVGIKNMSFFPMKDPSLRELMVDLNPDDPNGVGLAPMGGIPSQVGVEDCLGGQGLYGPAEEYIKVLHSLLANDGKLLKPATVDTMFQPHWEAPAHHFANKVIADIMAATPLGAGLPKESERDFGLGGMFVQTDQPGHFQEGTLVWGGAMNTVWFIDRKSGLCGIGSPQPYLRDAPATRGADYVFKPHREGALPWEASTDHYKHAFRSGIYQVYESQKSQT